jgi:hypothetical protein
MEHLMVDILIQVMNILTSMRKPTVVSIGIGLLLMFIALFIYEDVVRGKL